MINGEQNGWNQYAIVIQIVNRKSRCFELGEDVEYVSRDIEYNRTSIYAWRRKYQKR